MQAQTFTEQPSILESEETLRRQKYAVQASILTGVVMTLITIVTGVIALQTSPDRFWGPGITLVSAITAFVSARISARGRPTLGGGILIAALLSLSFLVVLLFANNQGVALSIIEVFVITTIASMTLPRKWVGRVLLLSIAVGILNIVADFYLPNFGLPSEPTVTNTIAGVLSVIYLIVLVRRSNEYSLQTKLAFTSTIIALVVVFILSFQSITSARESLTKQANTDLIETAKIAARSIDNQLENELDSIRTEAQIIDLAEYLSLPASQRTDSVEESRAYNILLALQRKNPVYITSYALLDRNGVDVLDTYQDDVGLMKSDRDYFTAPMESGVPYISPVRISATTNEISIYFSAPVRDVNGTIIGVLRSRFNADFLQNLLIEFTDTPHQEEHASLIDNTTYSNISNTDDASLKLKSYASLNKAQVEFLQKDLRLPQGAPEEVLISQPQILSGIQNLETQPIFQATSALYDEANTYNGGYKLENVNWVVLISRTERSILEPIEAQTQNITLLSLIIIILAAGLGLLVSQIISRPLIQLSNIAGEIANGNLAVRARQETNDEIGALAKSFNYMTEQLFQTLTSLEQRVADRTRALATATEVSRSLSTILDEKQLVTEVVKQVQKAYNYYHGQIYLLDASGQTLVLAGATGEGGKALLDKKHSLSIEKGLVGRSARTKTAVLVPDTSKDPEWLPNPLLPDTKAEIAIPILLGETLLGVLDMQDDVAGDIYPEDIEYLTAISNQTAIALQNSRSLAQAQKKAEREALITSISQKIQQEATVESAMKVAIREVGRALGTSALVKLKPGNEEKQEKV